MIRFQVILLLLAVVAATALAVGASGAAEVSFQHTCIQDQLLAKMKRGPRRGVVTRGASAASTPMKRALPGSSSPQLSPDLDPSYKPIRIKVFFRDVTDSDKYCSEIGQRRPNFLGEIVNCTADDILPFNKMSLLINELIPGAVQLHAERLMVVRSDAAMVVPSMDSEICNQFNVPASHHTEGVTDADFVIYVSAGPTSGNVIAWATTCMFHPDGRPAVGVTNISPKYISPDPSVMRVVTHELLHALGFYGEIFQARRMLGTVPSIRGKGAVTVVNSPNVLERAGNHFGCNGLPGMELEDEGGSGTASSHWKRRTAKDDLMCGISGVGRYSAITIAAMEDLGFYRGNYTFAEDMKWGKNEGCKVMSERCIVDGVSQVPSMFCTQNRSIPVCPTDRRGVGECTIVRYDSPLPKQYQYFSDPNIGGLRNLVDYCPVVEIYSKSCATGNVSQMPGSIIGPNSRCLDTFNTFRASDSASITAMCVDIQCNAPTQSYKVRFFNETKWTDCTPGTTVSTDENNGYFEQGFAKCPPFNEVCQSYFNSLTIDVYPESWVEKKTATECKPYDYFCKTGAS